MTGKDVRDAFVMYNDVYKKDKNRRQLEGGSVNVGDGLVKGIVGLSGGFSSVNIQGEQVMRGKLEEVEGQFNEQKQINKELKE